MEQPGAVTARAPEAKGRVDDYVDIYFSPSSVFERRTGRDWVQPLVVLILVSVVLYFATLPASTIAMRAAIDARLTRAGADAAQAAQAMERATSVMRWLNVVFVPVTVALLVALVAAALWILGRLFDVRVGFKDAILAATFAHFVAIPQTIARAISLILANRSGPVDIAKHTSFGLLRFIHADSPVVAALMARVDVFPIWEAVLWGIALAALAKAPKGRAFLAAAVLWLLVAVPGMLLRMLTPAGAAM